MYLTSYLTRQSNLLNKPPPENKFKILDNKKISETLDNSFFLKKISEKFANKGFNF